MKLVILAMVICTFLLSNAYSFPFRGISMTGWTKDSFLQAGPDIARLDSINVNYISLNVYNFQDNKESVKIYKDPRKTPTDESINYFIKEAKKYNIKILLRINVDPQDGSWRARFKPKSKSKWFKSYQEMMIHYAKLASKHSNVEIFSIGMELHSLAEPKKNRKYWKSVAKAVRKHFKGKLTYGANWDIYSKIKLWRYVDIIGIDAYFPLSKKANPSMSDLKKGWAKYLNFSRSHRAISEITAFSKKHKKPVIFAELGFGSGKGAAKEPWKSDLSPVNQKIQAMCYQATLEVWEKVWQKGKWFKGMFWWNWGIDRDEQGGPTCRRHTPKGKEAEQVLKRMYGDMKYLADIWK